MRGLFLTVPLADSKVKYSIYKLTKCPTCICNQSDPSKWTQFFLVFSKPYRVHARTYSDQIIVLLDYFLKILLQGLMTLWIKRTSNTFDTSHTWVKTENLPPHFSKRTPINFRRVEKFSHQILILVHHYYVTPYPISFHLQ